MLENGFCDVVPLDILEGAMDALLALERKFLVLAWVSLMVPNDARLLICECSTLIELRLVHVDYSSIHLGSCILLTRMVLLMLSKA